MSFATAASVAPVSPETGIRGLIQTSTLAELVQLWLDDRRVFGRGIAPKTEAAYRQDLELWAAALCEVAARPAPEGGAVNPPLRRTTNEDLNIDLVKRAYGQLTRREYAPATRARVLQSLRSFCKWLVLQGHLATDPTLAMASPAVPEGEPVAFEPSELAAIVRTASTEDPDARYPWPARDRALIAVLAGAGVRASELCGLKVMDVMREQRPVVLRVTGKGRKVRRIPIAAEVLAAVDEYLADCRQRRRKVEPTDPLFLRYNYEPLTTGALDYIVCRVVARAGVHKPEGAAAHAFRHTYAKGLVSKGVPLSSVQALLGHSNLNTTQVYLRMTGVDLAEAVEAAEVREYLRAPIGVVETKGE